MRSRACSTTTSMVCSHLRATPQETVSQLPHLPPLHTYRVLKSCVGADLCIMIMMTMITLAT